MPGLENGFCRELFGPWLLRQIDNNTFEGVYWLNNIRTFFRVPWKHLNMRDKNESDYSIFKAWAVASGKYIATCEDPPTWKRNFRSALRSVTSGDRKMFTEVEDRSHDQQDPHKIYQVYRVQAIPLQPAFRSAHEAQSACENIPVCYYLQTEQNGSSEAEVDDIVLRISPNDTPVLQFPLNRIKVPDIDEIVENAESRIHATGAQATLATNGHFGSSIEGLTYEAATYDGDHSFSQNGSVIQPTIYSSQAVQEPTHTYTYGDYTQEPHVQCTQDGNTMAAVHLVAQGSSEPTSHHEHQAYDIYCNGYSETVPLLEQVFKRFTDSTHQAKEAHVMDQVLPVENNVEVVLPSENAHVLPPQRRFPSIMEWEVTISYKGKDVLKQIINRKCVISTGNVNPLFEGGEHVCFPSTDVLVDSTQIQYTNTILENVQDGLLLEVSSQDYKLYASRFGKTRVYWSMSEDLETTADEANVISRDAQYEIFDFQKYWGEVKDYKVHRGRSPDYTIYMSFGQNLVKPINRRLVLVKLVPQFCVYTHELLQRQGVSSLSQEFISLQISNGSSFNCDEPDDFTSMDIDFSCLV